MSKQPEALRLADALSAAIKQVDADDDVIHVARWFVEDAAAELRRLSAENDRLHQINQSHEMKLSVRGYEIQIADLEAQRDAIQQVVDEQAEDEGLWFGAETAAEAYLQQELRRLHAAVEGKARAAIKMTEEGK